MTRVVNPSCSSPDHAVATLALTALTAEKQEKNTFGDPAPESQDLLDGGHLSSRCWSAQQFEALSLT